MESPRLSQAKRMRQRRTRLLAALGISTVTVLIAATAHGFAHGEWPELSALLVALPFSVLLGLPLVGRQVAAWRIGLVVALDQTLFHLIASAAAVASVSAASISAAPAPAHHAHDLPVSLDLSSMDALAATALPDAPMLAAHLSTAAISFALLRGGWQLILSALARGAAVLLRRISVVLPLAPVSHRPRPVAAPRILRSALLDHALSLRGPPAAALLG